MELKTPAEWLETEDYAGIVITNPEGWGPPGGSAFWEEWATPITDDEFFSRLCKSTVESRGKVLGPGVVQAPLLPD